ncbi:GPI alpha-1,4-mannosyltransferase I, stabilizing subunit [Calliopsis andreniformis]|uniref:GPI alpha-1,4-mannosyltransferase I, stabilizing subunit n=1 Tax=Calliopsis andreniformis TaxID=337506 RepID=UPI003FCD3056
MTLNRVKYYFIQVNTFLAIFFQNVICKGLDTHLSLDVEGEGFHRYLIYRVNFDNFIDQCHVALFLKLPSSLYANINELNDLRRLGISTACFFGETDVELFAHKAMSQNVTICSPLISTNFTLKLPIHQRYQYASKNSSYMTIILPKPILLLGCKDRIKEYRISKIDLCSPCAEVVTKWREIPYIMDTKDVVWTIPVGNSSLLSTVICTTILATILLTIFLMKTIWKSTPKMDKKRQ